MALARNERTDVMTLSQQERPIRKTPNGVFLRVGLRYATSSCLSLCCFTIKIRHLQFRCGREKSTRFISHIAVIYSAEWICVLPARLPRAFPVPQTVQGNLASSVTVRFTDRTFKPLIQEITRDFEAPDPEEESERIAIQIPHFSTQPCEFHPFPASQRALRLSAPSEQPQIRRREKESERACRSTASRAYGAQHRRKFTTGTSGLARRRLIRCHS